MSDLKEELSTAQSVIETEKSTHNTLKDQNRILRDKLQNAQKVITKYRGMITDFQKQNTTKNSWANQSFTSASDAGPLRQQSNQ